jgi:hypothetical protein
MPVTAPPSPPHPDIRLLETITFPSTSGTPPLFQYPSSVVMHSVFSILTMDIFKSSPFPSIPKKGTAEGIATGMENSL